VDPQSSKMGPIMGGELRLRKKYRRVSGCSAPDIIKQKSASQDTWFSNNKSLTCKACT